MKTKSLIITLLTLVILTGCAGKKKGDEPTRTTATSVKMSNGQIISAVVTGKEFADILKTDSKEDSVKAAYQAEEEMWDNLESGDIPLALAIMGLSNKKAPTNGNDADIVKYQTQGQVDIAKANARSQMIGGIIGGVAKTALGIKGLDVVGDVANTFGGVLTNARPDNNNTIITDNGSTFQGAQADSTFDGSTTTTGLPVNPIDVEPVAFGSNEPEITSICPEGQVLITDERGTGCSDGDGGFVPVE